MPKVLVTDASERSALAVIRSLGSKGIDVVAADSSAFNAGFSSRYCKRSIIYPSPQKSKSKFIKSIVNLVAKEHFDLIIPMTDFTGIPISEVKKELESNVKVAVPDYSTSIKAFDKLQTIKFAFKHNIPHPKTHYIESVDDIDVLAEKINYPAVIKPRRSIFWIDDKAFKLKVTNRNYVCNKKQFVTHYNKILVDYGFFNSTDMLPFVQEYVSGIGFGVETLIHNSIPRAVFVHKRLREYPITGGASTLRISVKNEKLTFFALELLKAMNWNGVAMVEFKYDPYLDSIKFIEVNGRFWGSLPLAIAAGVDFPYLLYQYLVNGKSTSSVNSYLVGVKKKWTLPGEFLWLLSSVLAGNNIFECVKEFMNGIGVSDDIFDVSDPLPFFGALKTTFNDFFAFLSGRYSIEGETKNN